MSEGITPEQIAAAFAREILPAADKPMTLDEIIAAAWADANKTPPS